MKRTPQRAEEREFELTGGALCLDFANTLEDRPRGRAEKLRGYADLLAFGLQSGSLGASEARRLGRRARRYPGLAADAYSRALALREAIYSIFSALAAGHEPPEGDLKLLNRELPEALGRLRLERREASFRWRWSGPRGALERPLWPLARSAAELLAAEERDPIRECAAGTCSWLFLDRSRNHTRRWCDMSTCGNRAKARRYYRRHAGRAR